MYVFIYVHVCFLLLLFDVFFLRLTYIWFFSVNTVEWLYIISVGLFVHCSVLKCINRWKYWNVILFSCWWELRVGLNHFFFFPLLLDHGQTHLICGSCMYSVGSLCVVRHCCIKVLCVHIFDQSIIQTVQTEAGWSSHPKPFSGLWPSITSSINFHPTLWETTSTLLPEPINDYLVYYCLYSNYLHCINLCDWCLDADHTTTWRRSDR